MGEMPPTHVASAGRADLRFIADRLAERILVLDRAVTRLAADEPDEEAVHDVRVACRRLVGALDACRSEIDDGKRIRKLRKGLKNLRRSLGAAREAEVARRTLRTLSSGSRDEEIVAGLLAALAVDPAAEGVAPDRPLRRAGSLLARSRRVVTRLLEASIDPGAPPDGAMRDLRRRALAALRERRNVILDRPRAPLFEERDDAALHRLRIDGKKLRYTMEFYEPLFPARLASRIRLMKEMQDTLGDAHDLADLDRWISDLAARLDGRKQDAARRALLDLSRRAREKREADLEPLSGYLEAIAHPGFLPAPAPRPEAKAAPPPAPAPPETPSAAPPQLRIINSEEQDDDGDTNHG